MSKWCWIAPFAAALAIGAAVRFHKGPPKGSEPAPAPAEPADPPKPRAKQAATTPLFSLPTANRALFEKGGEERFFVGTTAKPWNTGTFGCVRSDGHQFHEGLDIRCLQRDRAGEPIDPVMATADGTVAYINQKPSLSNYGRYIILKHQIEGLEIYSLYAHLREIQGGLAMGGRVTAGAVIGTMGRSANTHEGISKERAHVHFELDLLINDRYAAWHTKKLPGQRNDHGQWNGQNILGLDPAEVLRAANGGRFGLLEYIRNQPEMFRVFVRKLDFPWLKRYAPLVRTGRTAANARIVGYELVCNFNGIPFEVIPRTDAEAPRSKTIELISVNEREFEAAGCRRLVARRGKGWELTRRGQELIDLVTY